MSESISITGTQTIARTMTADEPYSMASINPDPNGPWNQVFTIEVTAPDGTKTTTGNCVKVESKVSAAGNYSFLITPGKMPFTGTLVIG